MKKLIRFGSVLALSACIFGASLAVNSEAEAGYADNYNRLYYDLSAQVYDVGDLTDQQIQHNINVLHGANKFQVIDAIDVQAEYNHPMKSPKSRLDNTGFKAMAVVAEGSQKLFIAFAGSQTSEDYWTAKNILENDKPGQLIQAHLYLNYIYTKFPKYQNYKWYLTGHSLGGWLSAKTYLDNRAARTAIDTSMTYGGPIRKATISGVYTFNALPLIRTQMGETQWNANKNGTYSTDVKNLFFNNEWLNAFADMYPQQVDYIGVEGSIDDLKLPTYSSLGYTPTGITSAVGTYWLYGASTAVKKAHGIENFEKQVQQ
ncbi:lipase family protein [Lysinibacillus xylanilyticus]|uniref:hypothetical protein n=1 Tax=Lysinibacillus xylanilyticus TaxID=582475 RepID=UPI002B24FB1B|nr:hypothetical protein [Lysinibacillus xylanilyticus]MEB2280091.1 lipase family protein [Lysinibacillus xylanilyticus]